MTSDCVISSIKRVKRHVEISSAKSDATAGEALSIICDAIKA